MWVADEIGARGSAAHPVLVDALTHLLDSLAPESIPMLLWCPECGERHVDVGVFATKLHHTHACQRCGHCWRPAVVATCGVQFLPGFRDQEPSPTTSKGRR